MIRLFTEASLWGILAADSSGIIFNDEDDGAFHSRLTGNSQPEQASKTQILMQQPVESSNAESNNINLVPPQYAAMGVKVQNRKAVDGSSSLIHRNSFGYLGAGDVCSSLGDETMTNHEQSRGQEYPRSNKDNLDRHSYPLSRGNVHQGVPHDAMSHARQRRQQYLACPQTYPYAQFHPQPFSHESSQRFSQASLYTTIM